VAIFKDGRFTKLAKEHEWGATISLFDKERHGPVWIGTSSGQVWRAQASTLSNVADGAEWSHAAVRKVAQDPERITWVATSDNRLFRQEATHWTEVTATWSLKGNRCLALGHDALGRVWIGTEKEVARWDRDRFVPLRLPQDTQSISVRQLEAFQDGSIWVAADHGSWRYVEERWILYDEPPPERSANITAFHLSPSGVIWRGYGLQGIVGFYPDGSSACITAKEGLPYVDVCALYEDDEGTLKALVLY
jgi:ligand-binding sensor domain-containing protein